MDGIENSGNTVRIFTTNEKTNDIDSAFLRPGRIDGSFLIDKPDDDMKLRFVDRWPEEIKMAVPPPEVVEKTPGFSFAELEFVRSNLVINYLLSGHQWSLDKALAGFGRHEEKGKVGY